MLKLRIADRETLEILEISKVSAAIISWDHSHYMKQIFSIIMDGHKFILESKAEYDKLMAYRRDVFGAP